ncbi:MAG: STAS domain-containing protein [Candidatus Manganitrophus sp.]|nr:STAS domain-containing protein [Candidatus Manganitrophus sp.]
MNDKVVSAAAQAGLSLGVDQVIHVYGRWTLPQLADLEARIAAFPWPERKELVWDLGAMEALDTGGAWLLQRTLDALQQEGKRVVLRRFSPAQAAFMQMVARSFAGIRAAPLSLNRDDWSGSAGGFGGRRSICGTPWLFWGRA